MAEQNATGDASGEPSERAIKRRLFDAIDEAGDIDVLDPRAGTDGRVTFVVAGRDCPTEFSNTGEPLAAITHTHGQGYTVQTGEGTDRQHGYDVTHIEDTGLSLSDAVDLAATEVQD